MKIIYRWEHYKHTRPTNRAVEWWRRPDESQDQANIRPLFREFRKRKKERKFITKKARTQGKTILFFRDPFKLVPVNQIAEIADKFTRNEIMTSNEMRQVIGRKPSDDPKADMLINSNINQSNESIANMENNKNKTEGGTNIEKWLWF